MGLLTSLCLRRCGWIRTLSVALEPRSLSLSLKIFVIDVLGRNYWTANPTPIYGIKNIKWLPRPESIWIRQRRADLSRLSENAPSNRLNSKQHLMTGTYFCDRWMKMNTDRFYFESTNKVRLCFICDIWAITCNFKKVIDIYWDLLLFLSVATIDLTQEDYWCLKTFSWISKRQK